MNNIEDDSDDEEEDYKDIKFMKEEMSLVKTVKEAKWIKIENISFQNMSDTTFSGAELYFYKGEESSKEFNFVVNMPNQDQKKQDICLEEDLNNLNISKGHEMSLRIDAPSFKKYTFYVYIKSEKYKIRTMKPLKIEVTIKKDNVEFDDENREKDRKAEEEKREKDRIERERREKEEREAKQKEEEEMKKIEEEKKEREKKEKERMERERRERERIENERKEKEAKEKEEEEANKKKQEEEQEEKEKKEKEEGEGDDEDDEKLNEIFNKLEEEFYITSFKTEEEVKKAIKDFKYDEDKINEWVESVM